MDADKKIEIAALLISHGADIESVGQYNQTPLVHVVHPCFFDINLHNI